LLAWLLVFFLSSAIKTMPMGTAFAIWTGIGALGAVLVGIIVFNEPKDAMRLVYVGFIFGGNYRLEGHFF
jgi:quaternary ammonium compound-resistance protein SugE